MIIEITEGRRKGIRNEIEKCEEMLCAAQKRYNQSVEYLKTEIKENKQLGNRISANKPAIRWANKDKNRVNELEKHISKLEGMLTKECYRN